jgi:hypothetical protein
VPLEFFAPGIFIEEVPWRARPVRATDVRWIEDAGSPAAAPIAATAALAHASTNAGQRVPDQPVMLVLEHRRDGPWSSLI